MPPGPGNSITPLVLPATEVAPLKSPCAKCRGLARGRIAHGNTHLLPRLNSESACDLLLVGAVAQHALDDGTYMSNQIEIELIPCDQATQSACPLCGQSLSFSSVAGMLFTDEQTLGWMCERCLQESPNHVARRVRARIADLRDFVRKARQLLNGAPWHSCIEKVSSRLEYWKALATQLERLHDWPARKCTC
jgi:hypothetical protein